MENGRLTIEIETVLYRVMQEALTNVAKHSKCTNVDILLECCPCHAALILEDDGVGSLSIGLFATSYKGLGLTVCAGVPRS
jgi:signal transduction histidine kinase